MINAFCDGACRVSNPGQTSCAWVVYDEDTEIDSHGFYLGPDLHTNNYAEYMGLLSLLRWLDYKGIKGVQIYSDSKLVVDQTNLDMSITKQELKNLAYLGYSLMVRGRHKLIHVKGHDGTKGNERADQLCNEALDRAGIPGGN